MTHAAVVAAIDCGTNSTRLLIADTDGNVHNRSMRITRLGEGVDATRTLAPAAIARTVKVLEEYRSVMDEHRVERSRLVATSAARDAHNGEDFLLRAGEAIGVPAELLSGDEEAQLSYRGATAGLPPVAGDTVVVDIGGGSTELVLERDGVLQAISLDIGCVRLSERYLRHDPPTASEVEELVGSIDNALGSALTAIPSLGSLRDGSRLIGLAGTVSTLAALDLGLATYERARIHHATMSRETVERWSAALAAETATDRAARPGMVEGRQDVIVGGAFILREVMRTLAAAQCLVSESDILDGMVDSLREAAR